MADVHDLADRAPHVFRGQVMTVTPPTRSRDLSRGPVVDTYTSRLSVASLRVDRWYRGEDAQVVSVSFITPNPIFGSGHDCIDFRPDQFWIVFAVKKGERFEMIDDCEGALAISPLLGPNLNPADWPEQMEADFTAGLSDKSLDARLLSIQRLGGLKLPSSREPLHRVIAGSNEAESKWAVYAALRTEDVTVLPAAHHLLASGDKTMPESAIALELQHIDNRTAVPELIAIANSAPGEMTRQNALYALSEHIKDPKTAKVLAAFLSDPDRQMRYTALFGLKNITRADACALPPGWTDNDIDPQVQRCLTWWQQTGHLNWP